MATKVALTAEEFRENSQRSIALFNTEKLSTNSTHVLKSAYCNSVHFCRCNLHGACGGKESYVKQLIRDDMLQSARSVWRQRVCQRQARLFRLRCNLHGACGGKADDCQFVHCFSYCNLHGACGDKAKSYSCFFSFRIVAICTEHVGAKRNGFPTVPASFCCNLHAACGGKRVVVDIHRIISYGCNLPPKKIQ